MKDEQDQPAKPPEEPDPQAEGITHQTQTDTVKDYWEHYNLGDATAAVHQRMAAEGEPEEHQLDGGRGEQLQPEAQQETLASTEIIVPALPVVENVTPQSTKYKGMSVFDMKWNKHLEGRLDLCIVVSYDFAINDTSNPNTMSFYEYQHSKHSKMNTGTSTYPDKKNT